MPFAAAIDDLFFSELADAAIYTPPMGEPRTVRVIRSSPDRSIGIFGGAVATDTAVINLRVSDIAQPCDGDIIDILGERLVVQGVPMRDSLRLIWTLDTRLEE